MAVISQEIQDRYAIYNGDCIDVLKDFDGDSFGLSVYSPPFGGLYNYSSADEDMSNHHSYDQFFEHYEFLVREVERTTKPGRMTCVHCADTPLRGDHGLTDFPGDLIRLHQRLGFYYWARFAIWKEPLRTAIRTRSKGLMHRQIVKDSSFVNNAGADYLLVFKKHGKSEPIPHEAGLTKYCGEREIPGDLAAKYQHWSDPKTNKLAHWIWQQYASSFWDDIRIGHVLPFRKARDPEDEKHVHPLQLDVIERCVLLWSNPGDAVLSPFMGVGSEVYGAVINGRRGVGIELKTTYYNQASKNLVSADGHKEQGALL